MTDREKILAFLEGMSKGCCPNETKEIIINKIIPWINDLPEDSVSDDLEEAAKNHKSAIHIVSPQWTSEVEKAFKAGACWQKEKMMKDAIEREVHEDGGGYPYIDATEFYDYDKDIPLAKKGDKIKVIIVKED